MRRWVILSVALGLALPAVAAELRIGIGNPLSSFDIREVRDAGTSKALGNVYETLVAYHPGTTRLEPGLAESWTMSAFTDWTFKLRPDVVFSDGTPATASTVAASFTKVAAVTERAMLVPDDAAGTILFRLSAPDAEFVSFLAQGFTGVVLEKKGNLYGTGPYQLAEGATLEHPVLESNPRFRGGRPKIDRVDYRVYLSTDGTADEFVHALAAGEVDVVGDFPPWELAKFEALSGVVVRTAPSRGLTMLGINMARKPFDDVRVRRAIARALDRNALVRELFPPGTVVARAPLPPSVHPAADDPYAHDPTRARQLLAEAKVAEGTRIRLLDPYTTGGAKQTGAARLMDMIQADLETVGFRVQRESPKSFEDLTRRFANGDWDLAIQRWIADTGSAADFLGSNLASSRIGDCPACNNTWQFRDPKVDQLLVELRATRSSEAFDEIVATFDRELPYVPLVYGPETAAWRSRVHGLEVSATATQPLFDVSIAE